MTNFRTRFSFDIICYHLKHSECQEREAANIMNQSDSVRVCAEKWSANFISDFENTKLCYILILEHRTNVIGCIDDIQSRIQEKNVLKYWQSDCKVTSFKEATHAASYLDNHMNEHLICRQKSQQIIRMKIQWQWVNFLSDFIFRNLSFSLFSHALILDIAWPLFLVTDFKRMRGQA